MENASIDSWDGIVKNYLKAENLKDKTGSFVCEDVKVVQTTNDNGDTRFKLEIDTTVNDESFVFLPNYTNTKIIQKLIATPRELVGKRLHFEKVKVRNPQTNTMVDSISITRIE